MQAADARHRGSRCKTNAAHPNRLPPSPQFRRHLQGLAMAVLLNPTSECCSCLLLIYTIPYIARLCLVSAPFGERNVSRRRPSAARFPNNNRSIELFGSLFCLESWFILCKYLASWEKQVSSEPARDDVSTFSTKRYASTTRIAATTNSLLFLPNDCNSDTLRVLHICLFLGHKKGEQRRKRSEMQQPYSYTCTSGPGKHYYGIPFVCLLNDETPEAKFPKKYRTLTLHYEHGHGSCMSNGRLPPLTGGIRDC
jgi:hypothetical protein